MGTRILTFHRDDGSNVRMYPSGYYIESNYIPTAVRIVAESAPTSEARIDILNDNNVSIFNNRTPYQQDLSSGEVTTGAADTTAILPAGETSEDSEGDFIDGNIEEGTWLHCNLVETGGGRNFTVQLELEQVPEE